MFKEFSHYKTSASYFSDLELNECLAIKFSKIAKKNLYKYSALKKCIKNQGNYSTKSIDLPIAGKLSKYIVRKRKEYLKERRSMINFLLKRS